MAVSVKEREIQKLVRFYRSAIRDLAKEFVAVADFEKPASFVKIQQAFGILDQIDEKAVSWAKRNISGLYEAASKSAERELRRMGVGEAALSRAKAFSVVNRTAIEALLVDPDAGFLSSVKRATNQIRERMRSIQNQAKLLTRSQRLFDQSIAKVGFLEGRDLNAVRDDIVREMLTLKNNRDLLFANRASQLPPGQIIRDVSELPFVKIPDTRAASGFRRLRADKYAELLARTKTAQAANLARRNKALEHQVELMQISKNKPLHDDACFLYIGKVFALTQSAKEEYGVPMLAELPNGGAPFHPHCTHQELQFVVEFEHEEEKSRAFIPPPEWALNRSWPEVQKEYVKRGGAGSIGKFNKQTRLQTTGGRERISAERGRPADSTAPQPQPAPPPIRAPEPPKPPPPALAGDLEKSLLPSVAQVATGAPFAKTFEGIASEGMERFLTEASRRIVDDALQALKNLSPKSKARLIDDVSPRLVEGGIRAAETNLIRSLGDEVRGALDSRIIDQLAEGLSVDAPNFDDQLRAFARAQQKRLIRSSREGLDQMKVGGVNSSEVRDLIDDSISGPVDDALAAGRILEKRIGEFIRTKQHSAAVAGLENAKRRILEDADEFFDDWLQRARAGAREYADDLAREAFDDKRIVDSVAFEISESDEVRSLVKGYVQQIEQVELDLITLNHETRATMLVSEIETLTPNIRKMLKELGTDDLSFIENEVKISLVKRMQGRFVELADSAPSLASAPEGMTRLPNWARKQLNKSVIREDVAAKSAESVVYKLFFELLEEQKKILGALKPQALTSAQKAVDKFVDLDSFKSTPLPNPDTLKSALESIALEEAKISLGPLKQFGMSEAQIAEHAKDVIEGLAEKAVLKVQSKLGKTVDGNLAGLKFTKKGVPTKKSAKEVSVRLTYEYLEEEAAGFAARGFSFLPRSLKNKSRVFEMLKGKLGEFFSDDEIASFVKSAKIQKSFGQIREDLAVVRQSLRDEGIYVGSLSKEDILGRLQRVRAARTRAPTVKPTPAIEVSHARLRDPLVVDPGDFPGLDEVEGLKVVRRLGGSTGAELVEDSRGRKFVRKRGVTQDQIREEFRAEKIYRALGVNVPESQLYETSRGPVKLSAFKDGRELGSLSTAEQRRVFKELQEDFGIDAALSNWDVAGLELDNVLVDSAGRAWRIDVGGSLRYRATGKLKGAAWNENPTELWTLLDENVNPQSAKVFGGISHSTRLDAIDRVVQKRDEILDLIDDPLLKDQMGARIDELEDIVVTARRMMADKFSEAWAEEVNKAAVFMNDAGLKRRLPKSLKRGASKGKVVDENGREFDEIRGESGATAFVRDFINENGGRWRLIEEWFSAQGASSGASQSRAIRYLIFTDRPGLDAAKLYWRTYNPLDGFERAKEAFEGWVQRIANAGKMSVDDAESLLRRTVRMWSAYNQQRLRLVSITRNDQKNKTLRLFRKEHRDILRQNNIQRGDRNVRMEVTGRGLAESTSLFDPPSVGGDIKTVQDVPHHRVLGTWWDSTSSGGTMLYGDSENEIIAILEGLFFDVSG